MFKLKRVKEYKDDYKLNRITKISNILFNLIFVIISLLSIVPFIFVIIISISSKESILNHGYSFIPKELSLSAYQFLWNEREMIFGAFSISVIVTFIGTVLGLIITAMMGYALSRVEYKLKGFLTWVISFSGLFL